MNKSRVHCWRSQILPPPGKTSTPCAIKKNQTDKSVYASDYPAACRVLPVIQLKKRTSLRGNKRNTTLTTVLRKVCSSYHRADVNNLCKKGLLTLQTF